MPWKDSSEARISDQDAAWEFCALPNWVSGRDCSLSMIRPIVDDCGSNERSATRSDLMS
ncbi:hypothetical protein [Kitasatospora paranensis]|uniref:hypothetical protein n=1 Tax=Kitasatospora paranensis TaxID=258053 RepID=UPI0031F0996B